MKKICVVTATRAEYGVLKNLIYEIECDKELELFLVVTGTHLSYAYGHTINEIIEDGFHISATIPILEESNSKIGIATTMGNAAVRFAKYYDEIKPDMLVVVGDRYEMLPICQSAILYGIPIAHISGGEITEGSTDDITRNQLTKMSVLHFPGCETYRQRIIQMGEEPDRVFAFGDIGVENVLKTKFLEKKEVMEYFEVDIQSTLVSVTFHPETATNQNIILQMQELFCALDKYDNLTFIFTKANADDEGMVINQEIDNYVSTKKNCRAYYSLGSTRYLSLLKYSKMIVGNSSSGIIEAPTLGIPTVNIGDRQKGRLKANSIIDCDIDHVQIERSIRLALSDEFSLKAKNTKNPYGTGNTSVQMVAEIKKFLARNRNGIRKKFFDIPGLNY